MIKFSKQWTLSHFKGNNNKRIRKDKNVELTEKELILAIGKRYD